MKLSLPSDFAKKIAETLGLTAQGVEGYFEVDEDKAGFFYAKLQPKKWLDTAQFKMLCSLVRGLNGEYVKEKRLWRIPGPYAKQQAPESPKPKADTTSTPQLPSTSKPSDMRGKAEVPDVLKYDKSRLPYFTVPVNALLSMPFQSRLVAEDGELEDLVESIRALGVLQPILVRPKPDGLYEIVAGERRVRAAQKAGLVEVPVNIKMLSDEEAFVIQLTENLQRKDFSEEEKSRALGELARRTGWNAQQIADKLKMSYAWVCRYLPEEFKDKAAISRGVAGGEAIATAYSKSQDIPLRRREESQETRQPSESPVESQPQTESEVEEGEDDFEEYSDEAPLPDHKPEAGPPKPEPLDFAEVTCPVCKETFRLAHHGHRDHRAEYYAEAEDE